MNEFEGDGFATVDMGQSTEKNTKFSNKHQNRSDRRTGESAVD
jgi:hypothetical protein